ncbi:hypothetical protein SISSUDRAFT_1043405 [Sistotremastrum suecicum HHB10207 ss-3]|uniref:Uncharacterized protein n=1 Tax=Sistotremastrum suecicum HHB10207 ss-3 TaxID=1314776 RepID=A0A166FX81_9AGAM|nr:hypothetical protein SISSUDRAFT_1043405 [Sistotremastrum suecicum HHB10207 ss-3]
MQGSRRPLCRWENPAADEVDYSPCLRVPSSPLEAERLTYDGMLSGFYNYPPVGLCDQPDLEYGSAWTMLGFDSLPDVNNSVWYYKPSALMNVIF